MVEMKNIKNHFLHPGTEMPKPSAQSLTENRQNSPEKQEEIQDLPEAAAPLLPNYMHFLP
jgi:hypothetical protein